MKRTHVRSKVIRSIGYDAQTQTLEIDFYSGGIFQYLKVPVGSYTNLMMARRHEDYLYEQIVCKHPFIQVRNTFQTVGVLNSFGSEIYEESLQQ